jgi:hypothetical protein
VMDETGLRADMPYTLIVMAEQRTVTDATVGKLADFVAGGGTLLTTGATLQATGLHGLLGVKEVRFAAVNDGHVLPQTSDEPTGIDAAWDRVTLDGAEELYPLYLSWDQFNPEARNLPNNWPMHGQLDEEHPEPAGMPAAIIHRLGAGTVIHLCTDPFTPYCTLGDPQILRWLREIVAVLDPTPYFTTDAPSWVDVSLRRKDDARLVHLVNQNPGRDVAKLGTNDTWVDEIPEVGPYSATLRVPRPAYVTIEPGGAPAAWTWTEGLLHVTVPRFHIHTCVNIR